MGAVRGTVELAARGRELVEPLLEVGAMPKTRASSGFGRPRHTSAASSLSAADVGATGSGSSSDSAAAAATAGVAGGSCEAST